MFYNKHKPLLQNDSLSYNHYKILNAGTLKISKLNNNISNNTSGFNIGVSWGKHGYKIGLLSNTDALNLANHILEILK